MRWCRPAPPHGAPRRGHAKTRYESDRSRGGAMTAQHPPLLLDEGGCQVFLDAPFATADSETEAEAYERAYGREGCAWRRAPTWSSFPASKVVPSFRAHSAARNRRRLWVFAVLWPPGTGPPFPASCAFADAAIPRTAVAAIPRGGAGGGRHPPDHICGHDRRGVKRTAFDRQREPNRGVRPPQPPPTTVSMPLPADAHAGAISETRRPGVCLGQALRSTAQS